MHPREQFGACQVQYNVYYRSVIVSLDVLTLAILTFKIFCSLDIT